MSFARESALTAGEQVILVQLLARLATYGLKTSDGAALHVPASVATAADTAAVYVEQDSLRVTSSFCVAQRYVRGG